MDKKTKTLNFIFWSVILLSVCLTFYKTIIKQDFVIINYTEKDLDNTEGGEKMIEEEL